MIIILAYAYVICGTPADYRCLVPASNCLREGFMLYGKDNGMTLENCSEANWPNIGDFVQKYHNDSWAICTNKKPRCLRWVDKCLRDNERNGVEPDLSFDWCADEAEQKGLTE